MPTWLDKILNSQFVMIGLAGLAFLIALWLVIVIVRMLTGGRLRFAGGRTRQARLGIVDAFDLDRQRQLIIVRRDNTEHLIMIGGPNDLVIESEIVRVEAREPRRVAEKADGFADNRIAAPTLAPDAGRPAPEEPLLPMAMPPAPVPEPARADAPPPLTLTAPEAPLPRAPTFPLPPRRPAPQPERRPPPLPESASRGDEPLRVAPPMEPEPAPPRAPPAPAIETFPPPPPIPPEPLPPIVPTQGSDLPPRPPLRSPPPSFLKPLPPRPPIRPLRRATPVAPGATGAVAPPVQTAPEPAAPAPQQAETVPPPAVEPATPPAVAAEPPAQHSPIHQPEVATAPVAASHPEPQTEQPNALESLEEEMAKLLGRG